MASPSLRNGYRAPPVPPITSRTSPTISAWAGYRKPPQKKVWRTFTTTLFPFSATKPSSGSFWRRCVGSILVLRRLWSSETIPAKIHLTHSRTFFNTNQDSNVALYKIASKSCFHHVFIQFVKLFWQYSNRWRASRTAATAGVEARSAVGALAVAAFGLFMHN